MYNESQKMRFIQQYRRNNGGVGDGSRNSVMSACQTVFNLIEPYEKEWGADLCTRTKEELQSALDNMETLRSRTKFSRLIILKDYVRWCIMIGVEGAREDMLSIRNIGNTNIMITRTVKNPKELQAYLDIICSPEKMETADNIIRCYYWLAFAGMEEEDILQVKCQDVDLNNMIVHCAKKNVNYPIYKEAVDAFKKCAELDSFVFIHPNYSSDIRRQRVNGDILIRGVRAQVTTRSMRAELSRKTKQHKDLTSYELSYYRVWMSGLFYRTYIDEINGIEPYFDEIVVSQMREKQNKTYTERQMYSKMQQLVRDYKYDYERWKFAWY